MALVVVPLTSVLLWLGWHSVGLLEQRSADQRVSNLEAAVEGFLTNGLHVVVEGQVRLVSYPAAGQELVNMIIAQRTYQANAQTIKTQDQILSTLLNMR